MDECRCSALRRYQNHINDAAMRTATQGMTTETAIVVVLWLLVLLLSLVLVGYASVMAGSEVDNDEEVEARSVAWKFI